MKTLVVAAMSVSLALLSSVSRAAEPLALEFDTPYAHTTPLHVLALNDEASAGTKPKDPKAFHVNFEEPTFTGEKMHQYLGLATLGLVALTAVSPKEEDGPHELFGTAAAITAGATVGTGFVYHWEDFDFDDGWSDPDNIHMMLGTLGAIMMTAAVAQAPEGGHAGLGIGGGALMATAVKITW